MVALPRPTTTGSEGMSENQTYDSSSIKVLKGLAEYTNLTLGDLIEGIVLHAFEGKAPFSTETCEVIAQLKSVYGCNLTAADSHKLAEND